MNEQWQLEENKKSKWDTHHTPYVHWWLEMGGKKRFNSAPSENQPEDGGMTAKDTNDESKDAFNFRDLLEFMPTHTVNSAKGAIPDWDFTPVETALKHDDNINENTVIVGIVDIGIALGHRRFRRADGKTRFLAAWQQSAEHTGQRHLPFGRELYSDEINRLLETHGGGSLAGDLDEDTFNRTAGLVEPDRVIGQRALDYRSAHGTHVLDLAAGVDPERLGEDDLESTRIIAVNLPPRAVYGSSGNFLVAFAYEAVHRILFLADHLWEAKFPERAGGFKVVINFSFGMLAGPKDGSSPWELKIRELIQERDTGRGIPTRLVMPAGNNNLSRGNARKLIGTDGPARQTSGKEFTVEPELKVPWRIQPSDHTSNFVEIWAKSRNRYTGKSAEEASPEDFLLQVTPPNATGHLEVPKLKVGQYCHLGDFARIYCYQPFGQKRVHFIICVAPTIGFGPGSTAAPAGLWEISLQYPRNGHEDGHQFIQEVTFMVQTDQSGLIHAVTGRQAYFDHHAYQTHDESGRVLDSYAPGTSPGRSGRNLEPWDKNGPVQRKGTQNALATWDDIIVVGGYRDSDGTPAPFSSTFDGNSKRGGGREVPTVTYPTDDGPAHYGLLAAGSRDGSVVALRGTSMATALATRDIVRGLVNSSTAGSASKVADEAWLRKQVNNHRKKMRGSTATQSKMKRYNALKQGAGRLPMPKIREIPRFGDI